MRGEFYKMDFRAWNNGTVDLTLEQEAAYLRLCHAMYDAGGPVPESMRLLQGIFRCGNVKAAALVRQLIEAGKIERTSDGRLTNRRVDRELAERERVSEVRRSVGAKGGSARRVTTECGSSESRVNVECEPSEPAVEAVKPLNYKEATEAIDPQASIYRREDKRRTPLKPPKGAEPDGFLDFRKAYPARNVAFPTMTARKRWLEAIRRGADPAAIIAGAKAYAAEQERIGKVGTEFVKTADVWLNQLRWQDYLAQHEQSAEPAAAVSDEVWRDRVQRWRTTSGQWPWRGSKPPDDPETRVPARVLADLGVAPGRSPAPLALTGTG